MEEYGRWLLFAKANNWKLLRSEAEALVNAGVACDLINPDKANKLINGLVFGEYIFRGDGKWACSTCHGNCGQCGDTDFLGNIGFNFDAIVGANERLNAIVARQNKMRLPYHLPAWVWVVVGATAVITGLIAGHYSPGFF